MFLVMMFINKGRVHELTTDGVLHALGVSTEVVWAEHSEFLSRIPQEDVPEYGNFGYYSRMNES